MSPGAIPLSGAFDLSPGRPAYRHQISDVSVASTDGSVQLGVTPPPLSFGDGTQIADLTYYAEKGCIVDVLAALNTPALKTLGSRMLADYAKMPHRRVAVASNAKILEFVQVRVGWWPLSHEFFRIVWSDFYSPATNIDSSDSSLSLLPPSLRTPPWSSD